MNRLTKICFLLCGVLLFGAAAMMEGSSGEEESSHGHGHGHVDHEEAVESGGEHDEDHDEEGLSTVLKPEAVQMSGVEVSKVGPAWIVDTAYVTGKVILNPNKTFDVRARFPGIVTEVPVDWMNYVQKGDVLARIESNETLRNYAIVSPVDGVVIKRGTNIGNVTGDDPIFTIADLSHVWVEFHVFPRDLDRISAGQSIQVRMLENGREVDSSVSKVLPLADDQSQTAIALVVLDNEDLHWRPGMTVEGSVEVGREKVPVAVRRTAIQMISNYPAVFIKDGDRFYARRVELGMKDDENVEVLTGLESGTEYVSLGSFVIKADLLKSTAEHTH